MSHAPGRDCVSGIEALPEGLVEALGGGEAYPDDASARLGVERRQTHISHLYLTRDRVYKLRKAVDLSFLCFATREARNADCLAEVALNRRLAPDVYLGVAPVLRTDHGRRGEHGRRGRHEAYVLGPIGETCVTPPGETRPAEHCVVMRRLPADRDAQSMIERGDLSVEQVERLAVRMARFHAEVGLGRPAPWSPDEWLARVERPVAASFALARDAGTGVLDDAELERLEQMMRTVLERDRAHFLARREEGRAVDGHGDLHLDAVWYERDDAEPVVIDCLEFDAALRRIDAAAELAFFAMDAAYRARADLGEHLLRIYAAQADDYGLYGVVDYHILHRALVRAGVAALATREAEIETTQREAAADSARRHLALMRRWAARPRRPLVIITTGLPGTGKSTVAAEAAKVIGAVVIASDRVRKHLAGVASEAHPADEAPAATAAGRALYGAAMTDTVYGALLARADPVIASGRPVVLDATHSRREQRERARAFCSSRGIPALLLEVRCAEDTTLARLQARLADERRISDAGPAVYRALRGRYEAPEEGEHWDAGDAPPDRSEGSWNRSIVVHTDDARWPQQLRTRLLALGLEETLT